MKLEEMMDELHRIREEMMEENRGKPHEVVIGELHARTAKVVEELGLKPAESVGGPSESPPKTPEVKKG